MSCIGLSGKTQTRCLPLGRKKLVALEIAETLVAAIHKLRLPHGLAHLRDNLMRAADNTALRLSEANGRTWGTDTRRPTPDTRRLTPDA